jgi:ABC-type Na+ transport system ATPase subunit NatA
MIITENLGKQFDDFQAVQNINLNVAEGELLALLGPNGAGKTTTLRALCGILPATSGTLSLGGLDIAKDALRAKRLLAYLPEEPKLFDSLTVWEHLEFSASVYGVADWKSHAESLLTRFQLVEHRDKPAEQLSRGLRQRTVIVCAYLHAPSVICFDEPMVGLDAPMDSRALIAFDYDRDGDQDVLITNVGEPARLFENQSSSQGNSLTVTLEPDHLAQGAAVYATIRGETKRRDLISGRSYLSGTPNEVHFGLGDAERVERLLVVWVDGSEHSLSDIAANQRITVTAK